jgi:hypothetical protein
VRSGTVPGALRIGWLEANVPDQKWPEIWRLNSTKSSKLCILILAIGERDRQGDQRKRRAIAVGQTPMLECPKDAICVNEY